MKEKMEFDYPRRLRFYCGRCGKCCGDTEQKIRKILLLKTEGERIALETGLVPAEFLAEIRNFSPYRYRMRKDEKGKCRFLDGKTCTIYEVRPLVCVFYPVELKGTVRTGYTFTHTDECPCIGKGPPLKRSYFERLFRKSLESFQEESSSNRSKQ